MSDSDPVRQSPGRWHLPVSWSIVAGTAALLLMGTLLAARAQRQGKAAALADAPKGVGTIPVVAAVYRVRHRYIGTLCAWEEARLGPQFLSGYLTDVKVRPGDRVRQGQTLAIIEPERAKAQSDMTRLQVQAMEANLVALARESERIQGLEHKGIVSENEAEKKLAQVTSDRARMQAQEAQVTSADMEFQDAILKAPFDGEVGERFLDPGAFVRPGSEVLTVVDRDKVRVVADAPEEDLAFLAPGTPVRLGLLATGQEVAAAITRLSPAADSSTRTLHFELDLGNPDRLLPVGTSAEIWIQEKAGRPVAEIPAAAATVQGSQATVYQVDGDRARKVVVPFLGEQDGMLFLAPMLPGGTRVVLEGRSGLHDGDRIREGTSR
jgi:RND family efflux transporter MFP subunit